MTTDMPRLFMLNLAVILAIIEVLPERLDTALCAAKVVANHRKAHPCHDISPLVRSAQRPDGAPKLSSSSP
jgi:hypothetical protein